MGERPPVGPLRRPGDRRRRPAGWRIAARRLVALVVLVGGLTAGSWLALDALSSDEPVAAPPTTTRAKPRGPKPLRIVFPEGFTRLQMAARITAVNGIARRKRKVRPRLSAKQYLTVTARHRFASTFPGAGKARPLEGFLFPATYDFTKRTTSKQLVERQLEAFRRSWKRLDLTYARGRKLTSYDVLIIASMIEREVQVPRERRLVSAVIYNRLRQRIPLGIDATLRYGLRIPPNEAIRQSQLDDSTPYNTRLHVGLPPTPIGNPGLASLRAAARPANVDYLYFVRKEDCKTHFFTADADEFFERVNGPRC